MKMEESHSEAAAFHETDHQVAYEFMPLYGNEAVMKPRPSKRRKVSTQKPAPGIVKAAGRPAFVPLLNERESAACLRYREALFEHSWSDVHGRINKVLREANKSTLDEVTSFVQEAPEETTKIPAAFIITGPNIASQGLLFEQLSETLQDATQARFVRIRSAEAPNFKATLKKIIREATARTSGVDDDDLELSVSQDGRKFLDYDLEALHAFLKGQGSKRVMVAFQDSEAFDSGLLSDLIALFNSYKGRIEFTLLFGVATSVELLQARLLKSTCHHLYGGQFDVVQTTSIVDSILKVAIAAQDAPLVLGPSLLGSLMERQRDQVTGVHALISSLKYAYMCHFYANPLSIFIPNNEELDEKLVQREHLEAIGSLPSFQQTVETLAERGRIDQARKLLTEPRAILSEVKRARDVYRQWRNRVARSLQLLTASNLVKEDFSHVFAHALTDGILISADDTESVFLNSVKKLHPDEAIDLIERLIVTLRNGDGELSIPGLSSAHGSIEALATVLTNVADLKERAKTSGSQLRSKYTAQNKVLRTTVVAQKVQLSKDAAELTQDDKGFTAVIDDLVRLLAKALYCEPAADLFLNEAWLYDSKSPSRDVLIPRPGLVFERGLLRPHDYLACSCCTRTNDGICSTMPPTSILYHLYLEAGALVNVADLWSAFYALVGEGTESALDERAALVLFYRSLAELRSMGFVKPSRKKADHIAKLKWL